MDRGVIEGKADLQSYRSAQCASGGEPQSSKKVIRFPNWSSEVPGSGVLLNGMPEAE
jgi:hypothetical protein